MQLKILLKRRSNENIVLKKRLLKRGMAMSQLVVILLSIVSFVLIAFALKEQISKADKREAETICHSSISLRANAAFSVAKEDIRLTPVLCKTIDQKVDGNREEIKEQVANQMARCWWMFNEGRVEEALGNIDLVRAVLGTAKDNDCFLCHTSLIDVEEIDGGPISGRELWKYMKDTKYPQADVSYLDYIQSYGGPGQVAILNSIFPSTAYGIVFLSKNKERGSGNWLISIATSAVALGYAAAAAVCIASIGCGAALATVYAVTAISAESIAALTNPVLSELYESDERDVSVIVFDYLGSVEKRSCLVRTLGEP